MKRKDYQVFSETPLNDRTPAYKCNLNKSLKAFLKTLDDDENKAYDMYVKKVLVQTNAIYDMILTLKSNVSISKFGRYLVEKGLYKSYNSFSNFSYVFKMNQISLRSYSKYKKYEKILRLYEQYKKENQLENKYRLNQIDI